MSTDQPWTPDLAYVRESYIHGAAAWEEDSIKAADFDRFLARVKRDAACEALDGLEEFIRADMDEPHGDRAASRVWGFRDTHYPETEGRP